MKSTYRLKKGNYYYASEDGKASKVNPLEVRYNGTSLGLQIDLYTKLDERYTTLNNELEYAILAIRDVLSTNGIDNPSDDLKSLTSDLKRLKTIIKGEDYDVYTLDDSGYIKNVEELNGEVVQRVNAIPYDVAYGYYKLNEDGLPIKDEQKYKEYWELI